MFSKMLWTGFLVLFCASLEAATYYISPTGNNANNGLTASTPWLTFAYAQANGWGCGDTLYLLDGLYGDGSNTGKPKIVNMACTAGNDMVIKAKNERQAHIHDNGLGTAALTMDYCKYVSVIGLRFSSQDNSTAPKDPRSGRCGAGNAARVAYSDFITFRRTLHQSTNRYCNSHLLLFEASNDCLAEDVEFYSFHRHALYMAGKRNVARRCYSNERAGGIAGGDNGRIGGADAGVSLYPCVDCIVENCIADATGPVGHYLSESNAAGNSTSTKYLGCIGYGNSGNGIYINARGTGVMWMPVNNTIRDVVFAEHRGSSALKIQGTKNTVVDHVTLINSLSSSAPTSTGIAADVYSAYPGDGVYSVFITNTLSMNWVDFGFHVKPPITDWSGNYVRAYNCKQAAFFPAPPSNWSNYSSTVNPAMGTCVAWIPENSPLKRAGKNGEDIGANVLYRYKNGVITNEPLWDPRTGEFPRGAIVSGVNDIPGHSVFDVHKRLNVNCNSCLFPASYPKPGPAPAITPARAGSTSGQAFLTITPNFAGLSISIKTDVQHPAVVEMYNLQGKKIETLRNVNGTSIQWQRGNQPAGVYFVKASSRGMMETAKALLD